MQEPPGTVPDAPRPAAPRRRRRRGARVGLWLVLSMGLLALAATFAVLGLTGKPIRLPVWVVAEAEARANRALGPAALAASVAIGGIEVTVDDDWVPRLRLDDLRLLQRGGRTLATLPEARIAFSPEGLLRGELRPRSLRISGAQLALRRDAEGRFDIDLGEGFAGPEVDSFAGVIDAVERAFAHPALAELSAIEAEALALSLTDARTGRRWEVGDGRLVIQNAATTLSAELGFGLVGGEAAPARSVMTFVTEKDSAAARITATIDRVAARDLAAQAAPLAWLGVLDAPISGRLSVALAPDGRLGTLEGRLDIARGAIRPEGAAAPIGFDRAVMDLRYDPALARITMSSLALESPSLRFGATGQAYLVDAGGRPMTGPAAGRLPAAFLGQMRMTDVKVDPAGLFETPVAFSEGALDLRLTLDPFRIEIGQLALVAGDRRVRATGDVAALPEGWRIGLDFALNEIGHADLLALWPLRLVPRTREWLAQNLLSGTLFDVAGAVRLAPGAAPRLAIGYGFTGTEVRFIRTLPPIVGGAGHATIEGRTYTVVLDSGTVTPPEGGPIDAAGSVFRVPDVTARPTTAEIALATTSSLTAALSLLDEEPFGFLKKAGQPVVLGEGRAELAARLSLPLVRKVMPGDVDYSVEGRLVDVRSSVLVPGRTITAPELWLRADPRGLRISGPGLFGKVPFDATYAQGFGPAAAAAGARISGRVTLSREAAEDLSLGLPATLISGRGVGDLAVTLKRGAAPELTLSSDLAGVGLSLPELGWSKPAGSRGSLSVAARLGDAPVVERLALTAPGLSAAGRITLRPGGGLDVAAFDKVTVGDWMEAGVRLTGTGGGAPAIAVTGGRIDLARMPEGGGGGAGGGRPFTLALDRLDVTDSIGFTGFRGTFESRGGLQGDFTAAINGRGAISGTVRPAGAASAIRIRSDDAGTALAAAGVFASMRGGRLDLDLVSRGARGSYDGKATIRSFRIRNNSILAELLNAISVVGLLEQLAGSGIAFSDATLDFRVAPGAVEITRGSAIGASLGVSLAGVYRSDTGRLSLQGVVSPIYLVNGIGAVLTRRGEGLFGFNFRVDGSAEAPQVSVNPLSILTPGMFREIFRRPPPVLGEGG